MITAIALDDEPLALVIVKQFCSRIDFIDLKKTFTETEEALAYLKENPVDLLFLDIKMPAISGIDFYKMAGQDTMVIFTTAHSEYAIEGFNLNAIDYLLKPFDFNRFKHAVTKAQDFYNYSKDKTDEPKPFLFIRADYSMVKIELKDILFIEGLDNYLKIHLDNAKPITARMSMKTMIEKLPAKDFLRVHRSYIVPLNKIQSVRNKTIQLPNKEIPVGTNYVDIVQQAFKQ
ncbi:MAG TPA: LytTR family DNA-binding domain-containing protein [Flavipsychrobacter sp.]|jgi:DNA-binding LytR/AlgR family response regulator